MDSLVRVKAIGSFFLSCRHRDGGIPSTPTMWEEGTVGMSSLCSGCTSGNVNPSNPWEKLISESARLLIISRYIPSWFVIFGGKKKKKNVIMRKLRWMTTSRVKVVLDLIWLGEDATTLLIMGLLAIVQQSRKPLPSHFSWWAHWAVDQPLVRGCCSSCACCRSCAKWLWMN